MKEGSKLGWVTFLGVVMLLILGLILCGAFVISAMLFSSNSTPTEYRGRVIILLVVAAALLALCFSAAIFLALKARKEADTDLDLEEEKGWWERFTDKHPGSKGLPTTILIIVGSVLLMHIICYCVDYQFWKAAWNHKVFWALQAAIVLAPILLKITDNSTAKLFLKAAFGLAMLAWVTVWWEGRRNNDSNLEKRENVANQQKLVEALDLEQKIRNGEKVIIPKGESRKYLWREIQGISAVPVLARFNNEQGEWKHFEPGSVEKPGELSRLDARITVVELTSPDYDIEVYYKPGKNPGSQ